MSDSTFGFIGLGLIGGSIARGLRRANKDITIMAYMRTRSKLEQAKKEGTIDIILDGIDETLSACDIIFLCTPVEYNAMYLEKVRPFLKPGAIITDIGSTKTDIHKAVERLGYEDVFVGLVIRWQALKRPVMRVQLTIFSKMPTILLLRPQDRLRNRSTGSAKSPWRSVPCRLFWITMSTIFLSPRSVISRTLLRPVSSILSMTMIRRTRS